MNDMTMAEKLDRVQQIVAEATPLCEQAFYATGTCAERLRAAVDKLPFSAKLTLAHVLVAARFLDEHAEVIATDDGGGRVNFSDGSSLTGHAQVVH